MEKVKRFFLNLDDTISMIALSLIVIVMVIGVVMRYIIGNPLQWTEEACTSLFIWFTFFGNSSVTKKDGHVGIDFIVGKFPQPLQVFFAWLRWLIIFTVYLFVLVILGWQLMENAGDKILTTLGISYMWVDISVPVGGFLALIHLIRLAIRKVKGKGIEA